MHTRARHRVGIVVGLAAEARVLMPSSRRQQSGLIELADNSVMCISGVGAARARAAARRLLEAGAEALVSFGSAAALEPSLAAGTVLLPQAAITASRREPIAVHAEWARNLEQRLDRRVALSRPPLLVQVDQPMLVAAQKSSLHETTGATAADMESEAVIAEALRVGVPALIVRAVADNAVQCVPQAALSAVRDDGGTDLRALALAVARRPGSLAALVSLGVGFRKACRALSHAVAVVGPRLGAP